MTSTGTVCCEARVLAIMDSKAPFFSSPLCEGYSLSMTSVEERIQGKCLKKRRISQRQSFFYELKLLQNCYFNGSAFSISCIHICPEID